MALTMDNGVAREMTAEEISEWEARQGQQNIELVPETITNGQGREALLNAGLLNLVDPAIESIPDEDTRQRAQIAWRYRPTFERYSPFVALMAGPLGLNEEQLDQLFIDAAKL